MKLKMIRESMFEGTESILWNKLCEVQKDYIKSNGKQFSDYEGYYLVDTKNGKKFVACLDIDDDSAEPLVYYHDLDDVEKGDTTPVDYGPDRTLVSTCEEWDKIVAGEVAQTIVPDNWTDEE